MSLPEEVIAGFLSLVGAGDTAKVAAVLDQAPSMVNVVGPHPFWGGRPQPLHLAIEGNRHDLFDLLLSRGADVNGSNVEYDLWSPLMLAINRQRVSMQEELLRRGARIGLLEALMLGDDEAVDGLLNHHELPGITPNGGSLLAFARTPFAIDRLLALGAPVDVKDRWGSTPLDAFSRLGAMGYPLVSHMIQRGVQARPQHYARMGDLDRLQALVAENPSIATQDVVMMAAVDFRQYGIVRWLLDHGGPVNARSEAASRHTALHSAAWNGDLEMVTLLIDAGADRTLRDDQYHATAHEWAETSAQVTNNPQCLRVAERLAT